MNQNELKQLFVLANQFKEGDLLVGGTDESVSAEAREQLGSISLVDISKTTLVEDGVTESLVRALNRQLASQIATLTVAQVKEILLGNKAADWVDAHRDGLSSEAIAAVVKTMSDAELSRVARSLFNPLPGDGVSIGSRSHFGSRIQPNSPGDSDEEILFSIIEGLGYGCGDVILGLNPASDDVDTILRLEDLLRSVVERLHLPTRYCVLSDIVKQSAARQRTSVETGFQSLAGTSTALAGMVGLDVEGIAELAGGFECLYFETGQGSEVTNGAAEGVDMVTLESRTYGVARAIRKSCSEPGKEKWMIVNDVAGFIGPEVFRTADQLRRACLEDCAMAKLHGITMGLDVCSTFHMGINPSALRRLTVEIVEQAAPAYLMAVAGNADPMLGYMTTSFREHPELRRRNGKRISSAMQRRLAALGVIDEHDNPVSNNAAAAELYAAYLKAGGDRRPAVALQKEWSTTLADLQARGFDLGLERSPDSGTLSERRMQAIYENARRALFATIEESLIMQSAQRCLRVRTRAVDREDYLSHPSAGERICNEDADRLRSLYSTHRPQIQIIISDGLNANAVNENLRELLPALRRELLARGARTSETDIVIQNSRVRAGYHAGQLLEVEAIVHLIGERPGTGLNMLSAYLTYGRDKAGRSRWSPDLDHSCTTAICGINSRGKPPTRAAHEIARAAGRMLDERRSGVDLT